MTFKPFNFALRAGRSQKRLGLLVLSLLAFVTFSDAKFEHEQLIIEGQIQERIERILSKTLPASGFIVTVKVEMDQRGNPASVRTTKTVQGGKNPFLDQNRFVLPGVPQKKEFVETAPTENAETVVNAATAEALIKRISIKIMVAPEITASQIQAMRQVISASVPFNPLRGDEMDIQPSSLLAKPAEASGVAAGGISAGAAADTNVSKGPASLFTDRTTLLLVVLLAAVTIGLLVLIVFLFGPVRAFLNRLLTVLPRVGEQAAYAVSNATPKPGANGTVANGTNGNGGHGGHSSNGHNGNGHSDLPFQFIREEQLGKLPLVLKQMATPQAAIVLAYLSPEWASRVLASLDSAQQSALVRELAQAREVPAETVKEVEAQLKSKLPYWVGGREWVDTVYQMTQPQVQRTLLGSLNQQAPELAQSLRKKSFFFEDLNNINAGALRLVVQEIGYPVVAQALKDERPDFRDGILRKLPAGTREIIQQELDLSGDDRTASNDAKVRIVAQARQMIADGRIAFGEKK